MEELKAIAQCLIDSLKLRAALDCFTPYAKQSVLIRHPC